MIVIFFHARQQAAYELKDFSAYWVAGKTFSGNPYDETAVARLEINMAEKTRNVLAFRYAPWVALPFIPLSMSSYPTAAGIWALFNCFGFFAIAIYFWRRYGGTDDLHGLALCFLFPPTIAVISLGQISALMLLGTALFLYATDYNRDWLCGPALVLLMIKPHLSALLFLAVVMWVFRTRRFKILISFATCIAVGAAISLLLNPHIFVQYFTAIVEISRVRPEYPTLGALLWMMTGVHVAQYLPLIASAAWVFHRFIKAKDWSWSDELPTLLMLGAVASFYSYFYDNVLILLALMVALIANQQKFLRLFIPLNILLMVYMQVNQRLPMMAPCLFPALLTLVCIYCFRINSSAESFAMPVPMLAQSGLQDRPRQ